MIKKLRNTIELSVATVTGWFVMAQVALAAQEPQMAAGLEPGSSSDLPNALVNLINTVGMPLGSAVLFLSVVIVAIEIMISSKNPQKRGDAMQGLLYVGIGGIVLGAALFITGALMGMGTEGLAN